MGPFIAAAPEVKLEVDAFYAAEGREARLGPRDVVVADRDEIGLVGVVRLCFEDGFVSLRSMQVRKNIQRAGHGRRILNRFAELLKDRGISEVYCMPYSHLEVFYGRIGFVKLTSEEVALVPSLLWKRFDMHCNRKPTRPVILMRRSVA
jgi:N-acetylglutamate synthase-like GNAT family acetyltransferase